MSKTIMGDDGLLADVVKPQVKEKHRLLLEYINITRYARAMFLQTGKGIGGATYVDLFCATGRAKIHGTEEWIDGGAVAAWNLSKAGGAPFSAMYVNDIDPQKVEAMETRLHKLGAPVTSYVGRAEESAERIVDQLNPAGLNFAFVDPYSLGTLDFRIFRSLARLRRIDILAHVSKMDLQRNSGNSLSEEEAGFDLFAPGWRENVNVDQALAPLRADVLAYWRSLIASLSFANPVESELIRGQGNQPLYWLALIAKHDLAKKIWKAVTKSGQGQLL